jgi:hypothetical protein
MDVDGTLVSESEVVAELLIGIESASAKGQPGGREKLRRVNSWRKSAPMYGGYTRASFSQFRPGH